MRKTDHDLEPVNNFKCSFPFFSHLIRPATLQGKRKPGHTVTWSKFSNIADAPGAKLVIGSISVCTWEVEDVVDLDYKYLACYIYFMILALKFHHTWQCVIGTVICMTHRAKFQIHFWVSISVPVLLKLIAGFNVE